ncbi:unnamed protein product [Clonostachys rhizophaga]|uniref:Kelch repeat-containing protein n=1 Tax=Clonostachys rhizophaga TaxID=160324 RepID=A0A9N9V5N6_9HYPO|nr:unnamed protein product [Clonostachys rhizophaga]
MSQAAARLRAVVACLLLLVGSSLQQRDPVQNFCRRWGHQTAVVDDKLYIDGGFMTFSGDSSHQNVSNTFFIYHDLSTVASEGMPPPHTGLSKNASIPNVNGGVFWPDTVNKRIYLFGGEQNEGKPEDFRLYSYDVLNDHWDSFGYPKSDNIMSLSYGAGVSVPNRGQAYYYGGYMNSKTAPDWEGSQVATSSLLIYDMDKNSWSNTTGLDDFRRAEGVMVYIPAGDGGFLVYFGGIRQKQDGKWEGQPMEEILLYDVTSGRRYKQTATGTIPQIRRKFCAGVTWVEDQSSYNIYLYGGMGEKDGSLGFDDVYVLSIPTFTWVKLFPKESKDPGSNPHHSMSCNVVNTAQMIVHGGFFPEHDDCELAWGIHNLDLGKNNEEQAFWLRYIPSKKKYQVPPEVLSATGGESSGGATKKKPANGWSHSDLETLMTRVADTSTREPTRDVNPGGNKLGTGPIVGIAIGSAVFVALVAIGVWIFVRRRRRSREIATVLSSPQGHMSVADQSQGTAYQSSLGPWSAGTTYYSPQLDQQSRSHSVYHTTVPMSNFGVPGEGKPDEFGNPATIPELPGQDDHVELSADPRADNEDEQTKTPHKRGEEHP